MLPSVRITEVYVMDEDTKLEVNPEARKEIGSSPSFKKYFPFLRGAGSATRSFCC
jgi:hypothetical protein